MASAAIAALISTYVTATASKTLVFNGTANNAGIGSSSQSIVLVPFGTASASRYVIIGVSSSATGAAAPGTILGATIGGITATIIDQGVSGTNGGSASAILIAAVPTGTSGTVAITYNASVTYVTLGSWSATGLSSTAANAHGTSGSAPGTFSLGTLNGGFAIGVATSSSDSSGAGFSWSGLTEQYDTDTSGTLTDAGGAHNASTNGSSISVQVTYTSGSRAEMVCASW